MKRGYKKEFKSCIYWGKDERESFKMVWAYTTMGYINESVKKVESWSSGDVKRGRERSKMTWRTWMKKDMNILDLQIKMVGNQNEWRRRIHVDDHWNWYIGSCNQPQYFGIKAQALLLLLNLASIDIKFLFPYTFTLYLIILLVYFSPQFHFLC